MNDYVVAVLVVIVLSMPLGLSVWALLDVARRPAWVWALAERSQVVWMASILMGVLVVPLGVIVSSFYLLRVRPRLASVEAGAIPV